MRFVLKVLSVWLIWAGLALAQDAPKLDVVFEETETIPGQPLTLRLTVLVPTFMPEPPVWPDLESPNLMVRLPEKASSPTSKTVNGETWSGISRRYQITPMVPGSFVIAPGVVRVTYQGDAGGVQQADLPVPEISVVGTLPEGAEGLDPFLAAQSLTLSQNIEGEAESLAAGGSLTRVVQAEIKGVSPLFIPPLTPEQAPDGLRAYPESPVVEEKDDRGILSGTRSEKTVYVAEAAVDGVLPAMTLKWYNLKTKSVEEATLPEVAVHADAPAGGGLLPGADTRPGLDLRLIGIGAVLLLGLLGAWSVRGRILRGFWRLQSQWRASEIYAWHAVKDSVRRHDLSGSRTAFSVWRGRMNGYAVPQEEAVETALLALGSGLFGTQTAADQPAHWRELNAALKDLRRALHKGRRVRHLALAALNPVSAARK
ncbi:hypothetical protein [Shimia sp. MMG029]|uniref:hypothetical protein n=1 Tax=Shimia sp. MMG029 TaxID=3021978 RepID=UPI0022FE84DA|nr:hypothetical protein [Shimia sp. MMG029]MDA5558446.1 hypothetical protein [Shimia sp. MMG029]